MVYGALPPEMRRLQARLFNDPASEYKVGCGREALCGRCPLLRYCSMSAWCSNLAGRTASCSRAEPNQSLQL